MFDEASAAVCRDALAILRQDVYPTVSELDSGETPVARKCVCFYEAARAEVLSWPGWNFAVMRDTVMSTMNGVGEYCAPAPSSAAVIQSCRTQSNREVSFRLVGDMVYTDYPIKYIDYIYDEKDISKWTPMARKALVYCLARDLAIPITGRNMDLSNCSQIYEETKRQAKLADARNSKPGCRAYGNRLSEIVTGDVPEFDM